MITGSVVEYIDQQKIISAILLQEKNGKMRLLNENNREVAFSSKRLSHVSKTSLDTSVPRDELVSELKARALKIQKMADNIDIKGIWEILNEEEEPIDVETMAVFCFDPPATSDHESAVVRAFFKDRLYFKSKNNQYIARTKGQVQAQEKRLKEEERQLEIIREGALWIDTVLSSKNGSPVPHDSEITDILTSYYLFHNDAPNFMTARNIIRRSQLNTVEQLFDVFVKAGVWDQDKNIELLSLRIPTTFSKAVLTHEKKLTSGKISFSDDPKRTDLTHVPLVTIDGQSTMDFDDAISLEHTDTGYTLGIHIIDVDAFVKPDDPVDLAARERGSSIYMPDAKLPMLPPSLSEDLCSLKENMVRPAISTVVKMSRFFEIREYEIIPSIIKVHSQMSYAEANLLNGKDDPITTLYKMATFLREKRLKSGAIQITLPEVNVWLEENNEIGYSKVDRENPSRMLVAELMILANSLTASFLAAHNMPAVFRSQAQPKQRLFKGIETSLSLNFMQRRHLSRAVIGTNPEAHAGLGVSAYTTATSPIRRYHDLLTQRQIKALLGYGKPYSRSELENLLQILSIPIANTGKVQASRKRYWILKYLEAQKGQVYEALVLNAYRDEYHVLLKEFMLETKLPNAGLRLKSGDVIQVTIQHANARRDQLSLFA